VAELSGIESKIFTARDFRLENGGSLPVLELAYETYGSLAPRRDNAILKMTFKALRNISLCHWNIGRIVAAALAILHHDHARTT